MAVRNARTPRSAILLVLLALGLVSSVIGSPVRPVFASEPSVPPAQSPTPPPTPPSDGNPITQIINQIIQFPFQNLVEALQNAAKSILNGTVTPLETFFSASIGRWLTSSPGIITPGGGIADGDDVMGPAWRLMVKVAVLMWPLTLAIIAAIAAKDAVAAASWGIGDLKEALGGWLIAVVASATSLYWMDLANRFTNATTMAILNMSVTGEAGFQPNALTALVFGTAGLLLAWVSMPAALIIVVFVILMGLAVLSALIFQFLARFVILYLLVALAPVVIILGVLPPVSWFRYMWLRGFVMVEAIGPINALLLKLVMILAMRGASNDPVTAFVNFIVAIGVLSILITVDGVIIKGVFGAADEVMQKAVSSVQSLGTLALAGVTALSGGSIAAGAVGTGGATAPSSGGGSGAGGASLVAHTSNGAASTTPRTSGTGVGGPASIARNAFNPGAALRGAGDVLFRQPGMLGSVGAAMRSVGGALEQREREDQTEGRRQVGQAEAQAWRDEQRARWAASDAKQGNTQGSQTKIANSDSAPKSSTASPALSSNASATNRPPAASPSENTLLGDSTGTPKNASTNAAPTGTPSEAMGSANNSAPGDSAIPPLQTPSVSPMGTPLPDSPSPVNVPAPIPAVNPQVSSVISLLPGPLGERAADLASFYANPGDQVSAAHAAVDAFNQVNAKGQGSYDIGWQGNAWDRRMGPVLASARQGLPLATMAQDAGFGGNVGGFLAQRMLDNRQPGLDVPAQAVPWHPQMSPHDWEMGAAVSNALGNRISAGAAARVYHEVRSPESGGGWTAGTQFIQTVQEIFSKPPTDPIAALNARLSEMETRSAISPRATALWRANVRNTT